MSKFLKFIVNLFLTLAIVVTAGIIVPPLLGVNTTIVDTASMDTNLPLGSVTYSRDKAVLDLAPGDEILKESGSATYAYIIKEGDAQSGEFTVVSATESQASDETIVLRNTVSEVVLTIPYIGFVVVAMQSLEGRIIIALVILFIIILFILSELWKKRDDDEEDLEDEDDGDRGNLQAASADTVGDAGKTEKSQGAAHSGYSENIKDNRGYGTTVSQDTASIAAAMGELLARSGKKAESVSEAQGGYERKNEEPVQDTALNGSTGPEVVSETAEQDAGDMSVDAQDAEPEDVAADAFAGEGVTGDTKVFPGTFSSQIRQDSAIEMAAKPPVNETRDAMEEALIIETEKAAAKWIEPADTGAESEPESLWSWTDEPFENELGADEWTRLGAGHPADTEEYPARFAPVERMTRQEILEQARSGGNDPKVVRDEVTGIDVIDYSDLL